MNILPKKSWHVRTKKNIERVRRDEANAAEEEKKLKRRIQLAEQEARTELLRKRAKTDYVKSDVPSSSNQHVNFFQEIEDVGKFTGGVNKEHEQEEKAIKEKFEKDIGLLTYLGQSSIEAKGEIPWYLKSSEMVMKDVVSKKLSKSQKHKEEEEEEESPNTKHKNLIDPLNDVKKYLNAKQKKHGEKELFIFKNDKDKKKKDAKIKEGTKVAKLSKIEELRAKRLKREAEERNRSQKFLESFRRGGAEPVEEVIYDDRARKYNSQFNPHLARNNTNATAKGCR